MGSWLNARWPTTGPKRDFARTPARLLERGDLFGPVLHSSPGPLPGI